MLRQVFWISERGRTLITPVGTITSIVQHLVSLQFFGLFEPCPTFIAHMLGLDLVKGDVLPKILFLPELKSTLVTHPWLLVGVDALVSPQSRPLCEGRIAYLAHEGLFPRVSPPVGLQGGEEAEGFPAVVTHVRLFSRVLSLVCGQHSCSTKCHVALVTLEGFLSTVHALVNFQTARLSETSFAFIARIWLFSSVYLKTYQFISNNNMTYGL